MGNEHQKENTSGYNISSASFYTNCGKCWKEFEGNSGKWVSQPNEDAIVTNPSQDSIWNGKVNHYCDDCVSKIKDSWTKEAQKIAEEEFLQTLNNVIEHKRKQEVLDKNYKKLPEISKSKPKSKPVMIEPKCTCDDAWCSCGYMDPAKNEMLFC
eukprot:266246_1